MSAHLPVPRFSGRSALLHFPSNYCSIHVAQPFMDRKIAIQKTLISRTRFSKMPILASASPCYTRTF